MKDDAYRRLLQLERRYQDLSEKYEALRTKRRSLPTPGARISILQPVGTIDGMTEDSGDYSVSHGTAKLFDLIVRDTTDPWDLTKVTNGADDRVVPLANLSFDPLPAAEFVLGISHNGIYVNLVGSSSRVFVAELNEGWSSSNAECRIYAMDGANPLIDTGDDVLVFDPLDAFSVLGTGDRLYVTYQGGLYYACNNAPCPT